MSNGVLAEGRTEISGKVAVGGLGVLLVLVVAMALMFMTGAVETLGYESRNMKGSGLFNTKSGYSFGLKYFYFTKGQKFFAEYETAIQKGSLIIHLSKLGSMPKSDTPYFQKISQNGKGTVTYPIQESGLYKMNFSGSVLGGKSKGRGYDLSYEIRWGIR